jgi:hypothetical protein
MGRSLSCRYLDLVMLVYTALALIEAIPAGARTWHVPAECPTIHAGLDSASYGDTVLVAPGTYLKTEDPETWMHARSGVCLTSEGGPEVTIIEFCNSTPGIGFSNCEGARVSGFTVRFGSGPDCEHPAAPTEGIYFSNCTDAIVEDCVIENIDYGISVWGRSEEWWKPAVRNSIIRNCGTGILCVDTIDPGRPFFQGNIITQCGWGVWVEDGSPNFDGNEISYCTYKGMLYNGYCGGNCVRNTIAHNEGYGVYVYGDPPLAVPDFNGGWELQYANDFYDNGGYDLRYDHSAGQAFLLAPYNWWGGDCPDFSSKVHGEVIYDPWTNSNHTKVLNDDDCPGATEPSTWGSIKGMFE